MGLLKTVWKKILIVSRGMGSGASRQRHRNVASSRRRDVTSRRTSASTARSVPRRLDSVVVQARFARPCAGVVQPQVNFATPTQHEQLRNLAAAQTDDESSTPNAHSALAPEEAVPVPYTPEGGFPPVSC